MTIGEIRQTYFPKCKAILENAAKAFREAGHETYGPDDISDEEYVWMLTVSRAQDAPDEDGVDVRLFIAESKCRDGEDGGVSFLLEVVAVDGALVGMFAPYNHTEDVWVDMHDDVAVRVRFDEFEQGCVPADIVKNVEDHWRKTETPA